MANSSTKVQDQAQQTSGLPVTIYRPDGSLDRVEYLDDPREFYVELYNADDAHGGRRAVIGDQTN